MEGTNAGTGCSKVSTSYLAGTDPGCKGYGRKIFTYLSWVAAANKEELREMEEYEDNISSCRSRLLNFFC
jgi:hypothetical protein